VDVRRAAVLAPSDIFRRSTPQLDVPLARPARMWRLTS
jgi:hypothetical protein